MENGQTVIVSRFIMGFLHILITLIDEFEDPIMNLLLPKSLAAPYSHCPFGSLTLPYPPHCIHPMLCLTLLCF